MFRNTYEFTVAMEHKETVFAIMEALEIRKAKFLVLENYDIQVTFKANKKELNKVMAAISKYGIGKAKLA